jgi:hypothetical protein
MRVATKDEMLVGLTAFVDGCVMSARRDRFLGFLSSPKGMRKWLEQLDHFQNYLDDSLAISVASVGTCEEFLIRHRLLPSCEVLVVSTLKGMDGVVMSLASALAETYKMGNGTIVVSLNKVPNFCLYLGEEPHAQYLFFPGKQP